MPAEQHDKLKNIQPKGSDHTRKEQHSNIHGLLKDIQNMNVPDEIMLLQLIFKNVQQKIEPHGTEKEFWQKISEKSLEKVWANEEDDIYNELLKK
jgi:hypothetical protein